jgi:hypothetical protein
MHCRGGDRDTSVISISFSKKLLTGPKKAKRQPKMVGVRNNLQGEFYGDFSHLCFADRKKFCGVVKLSAVAASGQHLIKLAQAQPAAVTAEVAFDLAFRNFGAEVDARSDGDETEQAHGMAGGRGSGFVGRASLGGLACGQAG